MSTPKEPDLSIVPDGYIDVAAAAKILGCRPQFLTNRRWVRRRGIPAYQLRRGWPIYFDEKRLREWCSKASLLLKPEARRRAKRSPRKASGSKGGRSKVRAPLTPAAASR